MPALAPDVDTVTALGLMVLSFATSLITATFSLGGGSLMISAMALILPPMVVVAFPNAPTAERLSFQKNFPKVCEGDTRQACAEVGILSLDMASAADYAALVAAYGN
mgnify:CR=1 FL=1